MSISTTNLTLYLLNEMLPADTAAFSGDYEHFVRVIDVAGNESPS
ncbi:hypothetical protein [Paenibacillus cremeus]|nr:hypothetical protein [Paenibacillus cremeus]